MTSLSSLQVPQDKKEALLSALGQLKEKVLMKWESDEMEGKPDNMLVKRFLPQQDILGHHNTKLFITHAGYLSFEESLCHQVSGICENTFYQFYLLKL